MFRRRFINTGPWDEMERLQREINRLFGGYSSASFNSPQGFPAMNLWSNTEGALVTTELPGLDIKNVDISVANDTLTITGERVPEENGDKTTVHRQERNFGKFVRTIQLPFSVNAEKVDAKYEKGILNIHLPRAEADKPRKISVKAV